MKKTSVIINVQLFIIFALSSFITSIGATQAIERAILSQPFPSSHSIDYKPFKQHNHPIDKLENNACELIPHFIKNKKRLLWQGTTFVRYANLSQNVYCLLTNDDKLYLFADENNLKKPLRLIDLSQYSLVPPVSKTPHLVTLSSVNPHNQKTTPDNTVKFEHIGHPDKLRHLLRCATHKYYCYDPKQDALKRLCKDNIIDENHYLIQFSCQVSKHNAQNIHIYCLFPTSTNITYQQLCGLFERYLNTNVKRFTRYGKKTDLTQNQSPTYWEYSTEERVYSIAFSPRINYAPFPKNKLIKVKESTCPNLSHAISSSDSLVKTCKIYDEMRKKDPFAEEKIDTEKVSKVSFTKEEYDHLKRFTHGHKPPCIHKEKCGAFKYIERKEQQMHDHTNKRYIHTLLFYHPRKRNKEISKSEHSPFIYEKEFASMHSLDMRNENPLRQLEDPRTLLKQLLLEVIQNGAIKELVKDSKENSDVPILLDSDDESEEEDSDDESVESIEEVKNKIEAVKYPTSHELPWLKEAEEKMQCEQHKKLGSPLNIAEICAIIMYTNTNCYIDLGKSQLNGEFKKWAIWDQLLIRAILKLHRVEKKINRFLYCGLSNVDVKVNGQKGFFKTYISTSKNRETGENFLKESGMLIHLTPEMQIRFPNCDISWISKNPDEEEILFARSADVGIFPAAQWQAFTFKPKKVDNEHIQCIRLSPVARPLVVRKGKTLELLAAPFHTYSNIKIEENGTLTTEAWSTANEQGGYLYLQCLGDCILEKNAKIDVSKKGYAGGTKQHPQGHGEGGGYGNRYCAAGGSHITKGSTTQCEDAFKKAAYHAQAGKTYGKPMQAATDLSLGSGGGSIQYNEQENVSGSPGGGALYLEVSGNLHVSKNAQLLANGGNAHSLSGGAGSGGSLCVQVKGELICPNSNETHFAAQGGNNEQVCHPLAQGSGGNGNITLHVNQLHIRHDASHEKIIAYWCRQHTICNTKPIIKNLFIITAFLLHYNSLPTAVAAKQTSIHNTIPHHVTIAAHYYNAKGEDYRKKAQYSEALAYHEKALQLQEKKYGNKATHPTMTETYGYIGETLAAQGNYQGAIKAHKEELRIAQACYQKTNAAHPKLLKAYTHLSIAHHGQGEDTEAMKYLKKAIQVSEKTNANKEVADVYDTRGLLHRSQANYDQAMQDHQKAADIRKQLYSQKVHSDSVTSCKHIGQTHHAQGDNEKAIASYQDGLKMWQKLYPSQPDHPDGAAIDVLLGDVYHSLGQYKQAITYQEKALISYNKTYAKQNHPDIADTLLRLGESYSSQGDYDFATYHYQKAIQMLRVLYKQQDILDALFSYLIQQGISQENVEQFQQWLERHNFDDEALLEDLQGNQADANIATYDPTIYPLLKRFLQEQTPTTLDEPFHPAIADALEQQGNAYLHFGNATKALQNHQKADAIRQLAYSDPAHPKRIGSCNSIAHYHLHQKQYKEALQILNKGIQAWQEQHDTRTHPSIALAYRLRGFGYYNQARYALAHQEHQMSLSIHKKLYGNKPHPAIADDHHAIADTYAKQKQYKGNENSALFHYTRALTIRQKIYKDIPYHPSIAAALTAIGTIYAAIGHSDQAIANHVQATRRQSQYFQKENQIDHTLTLYVRTNASRAKALEEKVFPLHPHVKQFIDRPDHKVLLLHGDAGAGKSLYGRFLENDLWSNYQKNNQSIIPLFISLPALKDPIRHAITETLMRYGWDSTSIQALQKQSYQHDSRRTQAPEDDSKDDEKTDTQPTTPRLLIFLDGYDEINATQNLYQTNQLAQWGAKVIIGCRTEYLDQLDNYRQHIQADTELYICPFNLQQIDTYLDRIDTTEQNSATQTITWRKKQYEEKFKEMPSLEALSTSPFLLQLIVTTLPHLLNRTQITRADIYHTFIAQWITTAVNRMEQQGMGTIELEKCWEYARQVGLFMFLHERVIIQASTTSPKKAGLCKHFSDTKKECHYTGAPFLEEANTLLRKALPLKQLSKTTSSFLHQSIQEYCAAQALLQSVAQLLPRSPNELTTYFAKKVKAYDPITNTNTPVLNQKLLNGAPAIIQFLGDALAPTAQYPAWEQSLFAMIEASKKNAQVAIAAANSATILSAGGILLHDKDWAGICIPHAILDHAFLARTNLQSANLRHVSLRQAYLEDAQFQKANVSHIHFGEYPMLLHTSSVQSVSWSPDGKRLASASEDKSVRIWDVASGKQLQRCAGHTSGVNSVHWSLDGTRLASASWDKSVRIWDVATGKQLQLCAGHTDSVEAERIIRSPNGTRIASASRDKSVRIWDVASGKLLQQCVSHTSRVNSVHWSPDGTRIASASGGYEDDSGNVRIWKVASGKQLQQCYGHRDGVSSVSWSPDGTRLASAGWDKSVRIWKVTSGKLLQQCAGHTREVKSVHWSPDGTRLASASDDKSVRIWEVASGKQLQQCAGHTRGVKSVSWSPDGTRLASASRDRSVRIWDVASGKQLQQCAGHTSFVESVSWSPDGTRLASASWDNSVRIWDVATSKQLQICASHTSFVYSVSWSPDGKRLASASEDKSVRIWDVATGKLLQQCAGHTREVKSVSWSPDGTRLASASDDKSVRIWDVASGKQLQQCAGHTIEVKSVSWSPDGTRLASASWDRSVRIWDVASGKQLQCAGHTSGVNSVHWSPDGTRLASASNDKSVRIWEVATGKPLQRCAGHTSGVNSVHWSLDGTRLASASDDKSVRIWDVASGKQLQRCAGHTSGVNSVHWSLDGTRLASASWDKSVRIWDVATGKQLQLCAGHTRRVSSVSWSCDGTRLASASLDESVRIWEVATGNPLQQTGDVKKGKVVRIISSTTPLTLTDANFTGAIGLSLVYKRLVQEQGGSIDRKIQQLHIEQLYKDLLSDDKIDNTVIHQFRTWLFDHEMDSDALHWDCEDAPYSNVYFYNSNIYDTIRYQSVTEQRYRTRINANFLDAAKSGQLAIAKLLRERGANIHAKDKNSDNALHLACWSSGSEEMVTWLLDVCKLGIETKGFNQITPFLCAARKGKLKIANLLKERGANIHAKDKEGNNALHYAWLSGNVPMVTWLLDECKISIETKGDPKKTPFLWAAQNGHLEIAKRLKERGAKIHAKDEDGNNALHLAFRYSDIDMFTWLLDVCKIDIETKGSGQRTPFLYAVYGDWLEIAKLLKERGANVNVKDKEGNNALHLAFRYSDIDMFTWLLDVCKIDIETKDGYYQRTPFLYAVAEGKLAIAKLLKERGANVNVKDKDGNNALHLACHDSSTVPMVTWLLDVCKIDIEAKGNGQQTPFLSAAKQGKLEIAKLLKERDANIHATDKDGYNALHLACLFDNVEMTKWLLEDCKIEIETKGDPAPFLWAAQNGHLEIAKLLKERGANIHAKDEDGNNALHLACHDSSTVPMVTWLLDVCKIDIEAKGNGQQTPFLSAVYNDWLEIAKRLKERGANIHAKDKEGNNALHYAWLSGNVPMVTWLLDECKISIEIKGQNQRTPFLSAVYNDWLKIAKLLKERGANIHAKDEDGNNALHLACHDSSTVPMVTWLLDVCKIDIEAKGNGQQTPFLSAAKKGKLEIAKRLKERGANIHAKDEDGNNALHYACNFGSVEMTTWLLDVCKIDIETKGGDYQRTPFLSAVYDDWLEIAKRLKERGANINAKDKDGNNALHYAWLSGNVPMVTWLLDECKISIEIKGQYQRTPFLSAVYNDWLKIAKRLKERGANIHAKDKYGRNALHLAFYYSDIDMFTWLLDVCKIDIETKGGYHQRTPFLYAVAEEKLAIAKLLKERGANVNVKDKFGNNALHLACLFDNVEMTKWLLEDCKIEIETKGDPVPFLYAARKGKLKIAKLLKERGANVNVKDKGGNNALHLALRYSDIDMFTWLLDVCKIEIEIKGGDYQRTPFLYAVAEGKLAIAKRLKERGANVNVKDKEGNNALHLAFRYSDIDMFTWLLDVCKIDIETKGEYYQRTPFLSAAKKGKLEIAKRLKERGANVNVKDKEGNNALHLACLSDNLEMTKWLLEDCKIEIETKGDPAPFLWAARNGHLEIAKLLKERDAHIHAKDYWGNNALHYACWYSGSVDMVKWLLDACKIPIETKGNKQKTPFLCAASKGHLAIAKLLKERGANIQEEDKDGNNALHEASHSGSVEMVDWLLDECKMGLETKGGYYQRTPFLCAAYGGQLAIAKRLKEKGANIHAKDKGGDNALHWPCLCSGSVEMINWLLDECKIDIETKGDLAPFLCDEQIVKMEDRNIISRQCRDDQLALG